MRLSILNLGKSIFPQSVFNRFREPVQTSLFSRRLFSSPTDSTGPLVYHAGLRNTVFTNDCCISAESQIIPIFRVLGYDGRLQGGWIPPFNEDECVERYEFMVRVSVYDMMLYNCQRQGKII